MAASFGSFQYLQAFIQNMTGLVTIWANQNSPRPAKPYATLNILSYTPQEHVSYLPLDANNEQEVISHDAATISIQIFSRTDAAPFDAMTRAKSLQRNLSKLSSMNTLMEGGWAFVRFLSGLRDLSAVMSSQFEYRAGIDIEFRTADSFIDDLSYVDQINLKGFFTKDDDTPTNTADKSYIDVDANIDLPASPTDTSDKKQIDIAATYTLVPPTPTIIPWPGPYVYTIESIELSDGDILISNDGDEIAASVITLEEF